MRWAKLSMLIYMYKTSSHVLQECAELRYTLPFKSLGSLRNVLVFLENIHEMSCKMNRKYSQDVDKVLNNDFSLK